MYYAFGALSLLYDIHKSSGYVIIITGNLSLDTRSLPLRKKKFLKPAQSSPDGITPQSRDLSGTLGRATKEVYI